MCGKDECGTGQSAGALISRMKTLTGRRVSGLSRDAGEVACVGAVEGEKAPGVTDLV